MYMYLENIECMLSCLSNLYILYQVQLWYKKVHNQMSKVKYYAILFGSFNFAEIVEILCFYSLTFMIMIIVFLQKHDLEQFLATFYSFKLYCILKFELKLKGGGCDALIISCSFSVYLDIAQLQIFIWQRSVLKVQTYFASTLLFCIYI